ncbi:hypothetical protein ACLI4Z_06525 [Natrialbaceae archaeon A-arb3/5]
MTDEDLQSLDERTRRLHDHLAATAELAIDPRTNRWLGEAEAVARDAASTYLDVETTRKRVEQVERLLAEVDEIDTDEASEHVDAARCLCRKILAE